MYFASTDTIRLYLHFASTCRLGLFNMNKRKQPARGSGKCPVTFALDIFGDKWSLIILRDIVFKGKRHYGEFLNSAEKISTNILASRLAKLESEAVIVKTRDTQNLSRFVYSLADKGRDLLPLLLDMIEWSVKYDPQPDASGPVISGAPDRLLERLHEDRDALIAEIITGMEERNQ